MANINLVARLANLWSGFVSLWITDVEKKHPEIAYQNAEKKFELGTINNYDFISARNRLDSALVNRTIAKYDYLFRAKVIEYYLGRGLTLN